MNLMNRLQVIGWPAKKIRNRYAIVLHRLWPVIGAPATI
jgi:hypothetical protein